MRARLAADLGEIGPVDSGKMHFHVYIDGGDTPCRRSRMVAVFGGFAAGRLAALEQMGFGLAVAVALDATVVRSILVPATMRLLGDRNWYLPSWLGWLPRIDVDGGASSASLEPLEADPAPPARRS